MIRQEKRERVRIRTLACCRSVVRALATWIVAGVPELALFVALDTVNRFTVGAATGLLLFGVSHVVCRHSTTGAHG
jgi:hypothetical protein